MPSVPELFDIGSFIGREKIDGNPDIKHKSKSPRHIAVAAEVQINLEGVGQNDEKGV